MSTYDFFCSLYKVINWKMFTPVKYGQKRRVYTTASTEPMLSVKTIADLGMEKEDGNLFYQHVQPIKVDLFNSKVEASKPKYDAEKVQEEYRKKMIKYLDDKFQGKGCITLKLKPKKNNYTFKEQQPQINTNYVNSLFKQFMSIVRQYSIKIMSEYYTAIILQELGFIKNMLDQRAVISRIWRALGQPNIMQIFVYIAFTYFHGKFKIKIRDVRGSISKEQICSAVEYCFREQGYPFSRKFINRAYQTAAQSSIDLSTRLNLLNNRQARPTCSSLSRSNSRKRQ